MYLPRVTWKRGLSLSDGTCVEGKSCCLTDYDTTLVFKYRNPGHQRTQCFPLCCSLGDVQYLIRFHQFGANHPSSQCCKCYSTSEIEHPAALINQHKGQTTIFLGPPTLCTHWRSCNPSSTFSFFLPPTCFSFLPTFRRFFLPLATAIL